MLTKKATIIIHVQGTPEAVNNLFDEQVQQQFEDEIVEWLHSEVAWKMDLDVSMEFNDEQE